MPVGLHFPFLFDVSRLREDLSALVSQPWTPHFNERDYGGDWSGIALRSATGKSDDLLASPPGTSVFRDTELLDRCPYFREVLANFHCPLKSVRLLSLAPQSFIREHRDNALGYDDGEIRIHVPIQTNPRLEFYVAGERLLLEEGHCYYLNVSLPHRVNNRGSEARIHLVIDADVNEWVRALYRRGEEECWSIPRSATPPGSVDDFRRVLLGDAGLRDDLVSHRDRGAFSARTMEAGLARGFDFHDGDIDAARRCEPLKCAERPPAGWVPSAVSFEGTQPLVDWVYAGTERFTEPFYEDTVRRIRRVPFAQFLRVRSPLAMESSSDVVAPAGFILHVSRCGSTLISRMLGAVNGHITISEAPPIDQVIQARIQSAAVSEAEQVTWLRSIVSAMGRRRIGNETRLFVKLDAWHNRNLPLLRAAFPDTPWLFVFRDPLEVLVSQVSRPGMIALPGAVDPRVFGLEMSDITGCTREEWTARVLEGIFAGGLSARENPGCLFVDYRALPEAVCGAVAEHFGLELTAADESAMRLAAVADAKNPGLPFEPDSRAKQAEATARMRELCASRLDGMYQEMREWAARQAAPIAPQPSA